MAGILISTNRGVSAVNIAKRNNGFKTQLDALVTAGTLTSEQETAVIAALTHSNNCNINCNVNGKNRQNTSKAHGNAHINLRR